VPFFLGIDGGGTKTRCLLGDEHTVLATGSGSGCNLLKVGEACAQESLAAAIHEACVIAGVSPRHIARTCAGIAGAADDGVASQIQRLLLDVLGGAIEVLGDMEIALESAFGGEPGVVVIGGTGSIAYGRNAQKETARVGGWGRTVSDEGSGHWIVAQAIASALRAYDRGERPALLQSILAAFEVPTVNDLVVRISSMQELAQFFPIVLAADQAGDPLAGQALDSGAQRLADLAAGVIHRLFTTNDRVPVATHGGVFAGSPRIKRAFERELSVLHPPASSVERTIDPALGALERARREFGVWHKPHAR
jgi:N-acetylglucosamine kinase-like BadF-type ATPase